MSCWKIQDINVAKCWTNSPQPWDLRNAVSIMDWFSEFRLPPGLPRSVSIQQRVSVMNVQLSHYWWLYPNTKECGQIMMLTPLCQNFNDVLLATVISFFRILKKCPRSNWHFLTFYENLRNSEYVLSPPPPHITVSSKKLFGNISHLLKHFILMLSKLIELRVLLRTRLILFAKHFHISKWFSSYFILYVLYYYKENFFLLGVKIKSSM